MEYFKLAYGNYIMDKTPSFWHGLPESSAMEGIGSAA
jgi:hypothetical protein